MSEIDKLYPPKIDNILPAFCASSEEEVFITIPFWLNPAVGENDFLSISYIIKAATSNRIVETATTNTFEYNAQKKQYELKLYLDENKFSIGQYYKIQIAFTNSEGIGYYSSAGISKYVSSPTITISQSGLREITGIFSDTETREKVYTYSFNLYDEFDNLLESSGELLHNVSNDTDPEENTDHWEIVSDLKPDVSYYVKYSVITTNNLQVVSDRVELKYFETLAPNIGEAHLEVENNFEEGYNRIFLKRFSASSNPKICGNFVLLRSSFKDNYSHWEKLFDFQLYKWQYKERTDNTFEIYKDYLIEQGVSYRYAIQAYSKHVPEGKNETIIYSSKLLNANGIIYSDFEDIFLYDGERQLKVRFNPKIGTFKSNLLESKIDTIGGRYPVFFRNGNVNYKEFSISGLISMLSDQNNEFSLNKINYHDLPDNSFKNKNREKTKQYPESITTYWDTELSSYNYQREREFKIEVLNWLTNGKEKVLKTPSEGNYIVRLMNTSLTPTDTFGRMLHSFTTTAYEIDNYNFSALKKYNFICGSQKYKRVFNTQDISEKNTEIKFEDITSYFKIDSAIIYTEPNITTTVTLKNKSTKELTSNQYGIIDLTATIENSGLISLGKPQTIEPGEDGAEDIKKDTSWPKQSRIEYSYFQHAVNTSSWYKIDYVEDASHNDFNGTNLIAGQGGSKSMKKYLNTRAGAVYTDSKDNRKKQVIISNFPYISVIRTGNMTDSEVYQGKYTITLYDSDSLENLGKRDVDDMEKVFIYRNLNDFALGTKLKVKIICPHKTVVFSTKTPSDDIEYAI